MDDFKFYDRKGWKTSLGFYLAVLCSSFGLISIWRFPYLVVENGGGAFLMIYFFIASTVGICLVMAELMMGKLAQRSLWQGLDRWAKDRLALSPSSSVSRRTFYRGLRQVGQGTMFVSMLVASYYTVISGWILYFLMSYLLSLVVPGNILTTSDASETSFFTLLGFALVHLGICFLYVRRGIRGGLERMAYIVAPVFVLLLCFLSFQSLTLPNAAESLRFLLYPDFTKITFASVNQAFGHFVLSLGLGLGTMITFGSYFKPERDITSAGSKVVMFSIVVSMLSAVMVCPMVLGQTYAVFGPKLLFQTLPQLILKFPQGQLVMVLFYLSLYLSALVASTGLLESTVANFSDRWGWPRSRSLRFSCLAVVLLSLFPLVSVTLWRHFRWMGGVSLLETADGLLVNYVLPILSVITALAALFLLPSKAIHREFAAKEIEQEISHFYPIWRAAVLWAAPIVLFLSFVLRFMSFY